MYVCCRSAMMPCFKMSPMNHPRLNYFRMNAVKMMAPCSEMSLTRRRHWPGQHVRVLRYKMNLMNFQMSHVVVDLSKLSWMSAPPCLTCFGREIVLCVLMTPRGILSQCSLDQVRWGFRWLSLLRRLWWRCATSWEGSGWTLPFRVDQISQGATPERISGWCCAKFQEEAAL